MRGVNHEQDYIFSYHSPADRVPSDHPLRIIKEMANRGLKELSTDFTKMYSPIGRASIPPEKLIRALLLQVLYSIRSERLLMEELNYNLLFRWFVGLSLEDEVWDHSTFSKNRDRLLDADIVRKFFEQIRDQAKAQGLLSDEHFTVDGTLIEAWASLKSFKPTGTPPTPPPDDPGNPTVNFHGERRSNATHASTTDPEARLYRKGDAHEAKLYYQGHVLMENRHGLAVDGSLTPATGYAEREQALAMATRLPARATLGADKSYDTRDFVDALRGLAVTPHIAQNLTHRRSTLDRRTTRHPGYETSQRHRKRIEEIFGWLKTVGLLRKTRHRGAARVGWMFTFGLAVYNLVRLRRLMALPI